MWHVGGKQHTYPPVLGLEAWRCILAGWWDEPDLEVDSASLGEVWSGYGGWRSREASEQPDEEEEVEERDRARLVRISERLIVFTTGWPG